MSEQTLPKNWKPNGTPPHNFALHPTVRRVTAFAEQAPRRSGRG